MGDYDKTKPLVIDPELTYSTYLGGTDVEIGLRIAVDTFGSAYITGAAGPNFPTTIGQAFGLGSPQNCSYTTHSIHSFPCPDAFVTKLNPGGTAVVYSTYLGGSNADVGVGIGVDGSGNAYVTGSTASSDFPTTAGVLSSTSHGKGEIFVTKLKPDGSGLLFSTFVGGSSDDIATNSALDGSGNTYITGITFSSDFATPGAYKTSLGPDTCLSNSGRTFPCPDAFVAKLNSTGTAPLGYATYLGGSSYDAGLGIAVDGSGNAYVTGTTMSSDFPLAGTAPGSTRGGNCGATKSLHPCSDAFVTQLSATGSGLGYSTYLGGNGDEIGTAIAVDSAGVAYVAGITNSVDFPVTGGAAQAGFGGGACGSTANAFDCPDAFVAKFNTDGSTIYATYLGGGSYDGAFGIAVYAGTAYVVGATGSVDFPTANPIQGAFGGGSCSSTGITLACPNAFLTKLNALGSAPAFSTYLGGAGGDIAFGVAVDASGNAYLTGGTASADFPTAGPLQANLGGQADVFIAKMSTSVVGPGAQLTPASLTFDAQFKDSTSAAKTVTLANGGDAALNISGITIAGTNGSDFSQTNDCGASLAQSANCTISVTFKPTATGNRTGTLTVADNGPGGSQSVTLTGVGTDVSIAPAEGSTASAEVAAGATATYSLTFTPDGFAGTMALTCTGAPTAATCTPSPASVLLDGTTAADVTVTVTTTSRAMAAPPISSRRAPPPLGVPPLGSLGWLAMLAAVAAVRYRRARLKGLALGMALLLALTWAACNDQSTPAPHGTPAGTYNLTLTGTAGAVTRSTSLSLKVD